MIRIVGPGSFGFSGLSSRIIKAVITFATLAAGSGVSTPDVAITPRLEFPTAAEPVFGHGSTGGVPGTVVEAGTSAVAATAGIGRK